MNNQILLEEIKQKSLKLSCKEQDELIKYITEQRAKDHDLPWVEILETEIIIHSTTGDVHVPKRVK